MTGCCSLTLSACLILSWMTCAVSNCGSLQQTCYRGRCHENTTCVCDAGWRGSLCNQCGGRVRLTELSGYITDSPLQYEAWMSCTWIIDTQRSNVSIVLRIHDFATECMWDHLYVFDGDSVEAQLLAVLSGAWEENLLSATDITPTSTDFSNNTYNETLTKNSSAAATPSLLPSLSPSSTPHFMLKNSQMSSTVATPTQTIYPTVGLPYKNFSANESVTPTPVVLPSSSLVNYDGGLELVARSGAVLLYFFSDAAYVAEGFNISYHILDNDRNCSGNGVYDYDIGLCSCEAGWTALDCSISMQLCDTNCSYHGFCDNTTNKCVCEDGFTGVDCDVNSADAHWEAVEQSLSDVTARASHSAVVYDDSMFIFGGYAFETERFENFIRYDFKFSNWSTVEHNSTVPEPVQRYGHSVVVYKDAMYMYGGSINNRPTNEFWSFNFTSSQWSFILPVAVENGTLEKLNVSHHTATVVEDVMVVLFGLSHKFGLTAVVQEYDFEANTWRHINTAGAEVNGAAGHASVYVRNLRRIFVSGGLKYTNNPQRTTPSSELLAYDLALKQWSVLESSGLPRYFHSMELLGNLLVVFGGNMHTDLTTSTGTPCYSDDFISFDLGCGKWRDMTKAGLPNFVSRIGHSSVVYNNSMYLMGGFNGTMHSTLLHFIPGMEQIECSHYVECDACLSNSLCNWCSLSAVCVPYNMTTLCSNENSVTNSSMCKRPCAVFRDYSHCSQSVECSWSGKECLESTSAVQSALSCSRFSTCVTCARDLSSCLWCPSQRLCINDSIYSMSFPYGQCLEWLSSPRGSDCPNSCSDYVSCDDCQYDISCGWCEDGSNTGKGHCFYGGLQHPGAPPPASQFVLPSYDFVPVEVPTTEYVPTNMTVTTSTPSWTSTERPTVVENATELSYTCTDELWYFTSCPACQCNGHSTCVNGSVCFNCSGHTEGDHCERCSHYYYGDARNGGECKQCVCNGHADDCDHRTGQCACKARGLGGTECERCDSQQHYIGNGVNGSFCYYKLLSGYHYTFNITLNHVNSSHYASQPGKDGDFYVFFSNGSKYKDNTEVKVTVSYAENGDSKDAILITNWTNPVDVKFILDSGDYDLDKDTMTVFVNIEGFKPPFLFTLGFATPQPDLNLPRFFVTFFGCFTSMLLMAALVWKIKQKWESFVTNRARVQEMAMRAARPFAAVMLIMDFHTTTEEINRQRRAGRRLKVAPVASEMCANRRSTIATVLVRLPGCENGVPAVGQSAVCFGSCLASVSNQQTQTKASNVKGHGNKRTGSGSR
ncbi:attractin-like isoform X2 [Corticium candelabrum]|uniref:attractin-like isoform X2 n=1 Tax=Corticium candelabrum TaxID=121492 RepID=UPI002E265F3E|nr:attractin-like isoform X2 [Corticium candelabrum]